MLKTSILFIPSRISSSIILNTFENQMLPVKLVLVFQTMSNVHYFAILVILDLTSLNVPIVTIGILFHPHVIQDFVMPVVLNMPNSLQPRLLLPSQTHCIYYSRRTQKLVQTGSFQTQSFVCCSQKYNMYTSKQIIIKETEIETIKEYSLDIQRYSCS